MLSKRSTLYATDSDQREAKVEMRISPLGWHSGGEAGPPGWHHREDKSLGRHSGEPAPSNFHLPAPRTRESKFSSAPSQFLRRPPGFDNEPSPGHFPRNPPGFDKSNGFDGVKAIFQEPSESTSDRPFTPRRRAPPVRIPREDKLVAKISSSRNPLTSVAADDSTAQRTPEAGPRKASSAERMRKKMQPSANDAQSAHAGTVMSASSFEKATPSALRPSTAGEPSGGAVIRNSAAVDNGSESPSDVCLSLWKDLGLAMQKRERTLKERERNLKQNNTNKQALEEEVERAAALKNEVIEERKRLDEEAQRVRKEKDDMERTSTDIAIQIAELKQIQKEIEKEKAIILVLKSELGVKERCWQEQECVEATVHTALSAVKAKVEKPLSSPVVNCRETVNLSSNAGVTLSNGQIREKDMGMDILREPKVLATTNHRYRVSVKAEPLTLEWDAFHEDGSRRNDNSGEDDMDDVPLAMRIKKRRTEKIEETSRSLEQVKHAEPKVVSSWKRAGSLSAGDIHMKRDKVPIEVALQEDAPGLLEQLEERGLLEDMAVYQDMGMDDSLPMECSGSDFGVLEGVIGKLWGPSAGLGKDLVPVKGQGSSNMPRYCLACLLSLIEQAKSLRKRNWPVEWGWCRRLRAFLFVFEKHNRIVLERPEYGYATYFFELVQKLPVKWQVQRLITVMSVATTGRAALLENRQLEVGVHLTNEEAAILEDYGWNPSSGLGSLLNFCERVVHDYNRGQEDLGYDWKQKIGKLLMDGYDHGSIVQSIPRRLQRVFGNKLCGTDSFLGSHAKAEPV